jgi:sugar-specific transcriptional regulator TrmB
MVSRLKELELSTHESLTYLTLLTHPNIAASALCKETGIPDSKIYFALEGLANKGMIAIQKGNPSIYQAVPPKEAIANLKRRMTERLNERIKEADVLTDMLTSIHESAEKPEELEVAYMILGQKNIISRMKGLIEKARKEVTLFISYPTVLKQLKPSLLDANERSKITLNIGVTQKVFDEEDWSGFTGIRLLGCPIDPIGMLISDRNTLITFANWSDEVATLTQDQALIRVTETTTTVPPVAYP